MVCRSLLVALISLSTCLGLGAQVTTPPAPTREATAPLRLGVLGASVSDGFGCRLSETRADGVYEANFRMASMLRLVCGDRPLQIEDRADGRMFLGVKRVGSDAAAAAKKAEPQAVIALDYLFWYCYGLHGTKEPEQAEAARLAKFEQGLAELAKFEVPVVVGDIPDMSRAVGKMLVASQMPPLASIEAANTRLLAWAKDHPNVRVVPLSKMIRQLHDEKVVEVAGKRFAATAEQPLLQRDELHATPAGLAAIACVLVDELAQMKPEFGLPRGVDPAEVVQRAKASLVKTAPPPKQGEPANAGK
jgi:hypothetical protein